MARYIDADKLLNMLPDDLPYKASVKRVLIQAPTADVVPKSEVDLLVRDLWFKNIECDQLRERITKAKQEVAREILNELKQEINDALECNQKRLKECEWVYDMVDRVGGKIDALRGIDGFIDELKKKYTESEMVGEGNFTEKIETEQPNFVARFGEIWEAPPYYEESEGKG